MGAILSAFFGEGLWAVIRAVLLLIAAFIAAAIVKSLVVKLLTKTKLKDLLGKRDTENGEKITEFIGKLVHLAVFLLFVPGIFESLGMTEVSAPILGVLNTLWGYLPNLLAAVLILLGCYVAALAVALALSFGIGGREFAGRTLEKLENNLSGESGSDGKGGAE